MMDLLSQAVDMRACSTPGNAARSAEEGEYRRRRKREESQQKKSKPSAKRRERGGGITDCARRICQCKCDRVAQSG